MPFFHMNPDLLRDKKCYSDFFLLSSEDCVCTLNKSCGLDFFLLDPLMESAQQMNHLAVQNCLCFHFLFIYDYFVSFFFSSLPSVWPHTLRIALHIEYSVSLGAFILCALLQKINTSNFHEFTCNLVRYPYFTMIRT